MNTIPEEKIEELWQKYATLIGTDISDLDYYAGREMMAESYFKTAIKEILSTPEQSAVQMKGDGEYKRVIKYLMKASDLIEGFGEKETSEFNRNIYFSHVGNLTEAIRTLEHYRFDESSPSAVQDGKEDELPATQAATIEKQKYLIEELEKSEIALKAEIVRIVHLSEQPGGYHP